MRPFVGWVLAFATAAVFATAAHARSLEEVQAMLLEKEQYYQPIDKPAPQFTLRASDGRVVRLSDFLGKVVVLHFIYAGCKDVCPLHAERIAEIQRMINRTPMRTLVQFISISTDPEHDTLEILRAFGREHGLDDTNWVFLTTLPNQPSDLTRKLVEAYGHKFRRVADGSLIHGVVTHVIDREGRWRANFYGLDFSSANLVFLIDALANDVQPARRHAAGNLWNHLLDLF